MESNYRHWDKYNLKVVLLKNGIGMGGTPQYPNGHLLGTIYGHYPMTYEGRRLSYSEEIELIKKIVFNGEENERYPLWEEGGGQICVYRETSFLYDTLMGGGVIEEFDSLNGTLDEKGVEPIMIIPTKDLIGLLEDNIKYQQDTKK